MSQPNASRPRWWVAGLGIAALVVIVLAPLASPDPDGLGRVARDKGFLQQAQEAVVRILPGYTIPGIGDPRLGTILAGLLGLAHRLRDHVGRGASCSPAAARPCRSDR